MVPMQEYLAKYEEQKKVYKDKVDEFMAGLGGKEEQDAYLNKLAEYRAKRRAYLKHFRLKKLGLIKVKAVTFVHVLILVHDERERERE